MGRFFFVQYISNHINLHVLKFDSSILKFTLLFVTTNCFLNLSNIHCLIVFIIV